MKSEVRTRNYWLLVLGCMCCFSAAHKVQGADVTVAVVPMLTPSASDELAGLPSGLTEVQVGTTFYAEVWARTIHPNGLSMISTDVAFAPARLEALSILHSEFMDLFPSGTIDNVNGLINDLSGSHTPVIPACSDEVGLAMWARVAVLEMRADAPGTTFIDLSPSGSAIYVVALCGVLTPPSVEFINASFTVSLAETVTVALVPVAAPSPSDTALSLPVAMPQVTAGATFYVELWAQTSFSNGVSMVSADVTFDSVRLEALSITHSNLMNLFPSGSIDNANGLINDLSGSHPPVIPACSDHVGTTGWARVALIQMRADAAGLASIQSAITGSPVFVVALCGQLIAPTVHYLGTSILIVPFGAPTDPEPDPSGVDKCRFISFVIPPASTAGGQESALRIQLTSLHHVNPPYTGGATEAFTAFEGLSVWVGPPQNWVESSANAIPFKSAVTQCTPFYHDWSSEGLLHVRGSAIAPSSIYQVENLSASCNGVEGSAACASGGANVSAQLEIKTTRWGDIETPYNPPATTTQPDLGDVAALVNKFKDLLGAPIKARTIIAPNDSFGNINDATMGVNVSFTHIASCVDAFKGAPYPAMMGQCAGNSAACTTNANCGANGPCNLYCP